VYHKKGDLKLERTARERVLSLRLAANDHHEVAWAYYRLFMVAFWEPNLRDQIEFLRLAYEEASRSSSRDMQALAIQSIVSPLLEIGDLNSARRALKAASEFGPEDMKNAGSGLSNAQGIIHLREGQTALAVASFEQALNIAGKSAKHAELRSIYLNLLEASLQLGRFEQAETYLNSAWTHAEPGGPTAALYFFRALVARARGDHKLARDTALKALSEKPDADWAWQLEFELGRALESSGDPVGAEAAFQRSTKYVEEIRRTVDFDDFKVWILDLRREPYEALFRLRARAGRTRSAIEALERAKARTFLDAFIRKTSTSTGGDDIGLLQESTERLDRLQSLLPAMSQSPAVEVHPIDKVLADVADKNVLLYFEAEDELWLVTLVRGRTRIYQLTKSAVAIRESVDRFVASPDDALTAESLGNELIPAAALPPPGAGLHIVTDAFLGRVPFASLRPRGRVLVRDYTISYVPSLNALYAGDARTPIAYGPAIVLGDPRGDLPAAAQEAADVAGRLGVPSLVGAAATRAQLQNAAHARVLHLATHTGIGVRGPWAALADGDISAASLINQGTKPQLAVLATCASAAKEGGDMWGSLASAFLAAGSQTVLASLWSVDDKDAREFITRFYDEGGANDSASALARTQRAFLDSGKPAAFWAPYVHFGVSHVTRNP
jgi:tetratricopeptide (TPR) repeat protein